MTFEEYKKKYFDNLDHGSARLSAIKNALDEALERQDNDSVLSLYNAYMNEDTMHGDMNNAIIIFPEYVAFFENHPELHKQHSHSLIWSYKWVIGNLNNFYQIPLDRIEKLFDDYMNICKRFNYNLRSYYHKIEEFIRTEIMVNGDEKFCGMTVQEAHNNMLRCKRDEMSDCKACELVHELKYIFNVEKNIEKGMQAAKPLLDGRYTCAEEPHGAFVEIAEAYFLNNDGENTYRYLKKAIHIINRDYGNEPTLLSQKCSCIKMMSYIDVKKALTMFKRILPFVSDNMTGSTKYDVFSDSYFLMCNLEKNGIETVRLRLPFKNEDIYNPDNIYETKVLKKFFYDNAKIYADKFDNRNGNSNYNDYLNREYKLDYKKPDDEKIDVPVFQYIRENIADGRLSEDFSLPNPTKDGEGVSFADGAYDGILLYHSEPQIEEIDDMKKFLDMISGDEESAEEAAALTEEYFGKTGKRALFVIDNVLNYIRENEEIDPDDVFSYGIDLIIDSKNYEAVKLGLCVLGMFANYNDALLQAIKDLALCNEFTVYCIWAVKPLDNGNDIIFEMAQKVDGWGKIHAVDALEPETDEIREWLLSDGIRNDVHCGYNAITCFNKADVHTMLENGLTQEQLTPVGRIMLFLCIKNAPTIGIRAYDDGNDIINMYLDSAERLELSELDKRILTAIGEEYENEEVKKRITAMGIEIPNAEEEA